VKTFEASHLIMSRHLNHHSTLFVGQALSWFVEAGFMTASSTLDIPSEDMVCFAMNGMQFVKAADTGALITYRGRVVGLGTSSITVYIEGTTNKRANEHISGFVTYIFVDENLEKTAHGKVLDETDDPEELELREVAKSFGRRKK